MFMHSCFAVKIWTGRRRHIAPGRPSSMQRHKMSVSVTGMQYDNILTAELQTHIGASEKALNERRKSWNCTQHQSFYKSTIFLYWYPPPIMSEWNLFTANIQYVDCFYHCFFVQLTIDYECRTREWELEVGHWPLTLSINSAFGTT